MSEIVTTSSNWWNKSSGTSLVAAACVGVGLLLPDPLRRPVLYVGLFALSGAVTNWLAIHMLFERVPGLYGSGVIPARFEDFKREIHRLIMEQFFSPEHIQRFFAQHSSSEQENLDFEPIIEATDLSPAFDAFVAVVESSSFGGLLGMVGGKAALDPMREPFAVKMKEVFKDVAKSPTFQETVRGQLNDSSVHEAMSSRVNVIVEQRLEELTPQLVKEIMQQMIRDHLGWLVVWGGVFGGLMGLISSTLPFL